MVAERNSQRRMRGKPQAQPEFLTTINLNQRVPADHPLRGDQAARGSSTGEALAPV